jgi:hypothetical protein
MSDVVLVFNMVQIADTWPRRSIRSRFILAANIMRFASGRIPIRTAERKTTDSTGEKAKARLRSAQIDGVAALTYCKPFIG